MKTLYKFLMLLLAFGSLHLTANADHRSLLSNEKDNSLVWNIYESKAFWGDYPITFWECSNPPAGGTDARQWARIKQGAGADGRYRGDLRIASQRNLRRVRVVPEDPECLRPEGQQRCA